MSCRRQHSYFDGPTRWRRPLVFAVFLTLVSLLPSSAGDSHPFGELFAQGTSRTASDEAHLDSKPLSDKEGASLRNFNIVLVLDHSHSMREILSAAINGDFVCKWDFVKEQVIDFAKRTAKYLPDGFSIVAFDASFQRIDQCSADKIPEILTKMRPAGGTNMSPALDNAIAQRSKPGQPLLLIVMTDLSIAETAALSILSEVDSIKSKATPGSRLYFLPVDGDSSGDMLLRPLGEKMVKTGKVESFRVIPFPKLLKMGLLRIVVAASGGFETN